jgi:hypothetical protein
VPARFLFVEFGQNGGILFSVAFVMRPFKGAPRSPVERAGHTMAFELIDFVGQILDHLVDLDAHRIVTIDHETGLAQSPRGKGCRGGLDGQPSFHIHMADLHQGHHFGRSKVFNAQLAIDHQFFRNPVEGSPGMIDFAAHGQQKRLDPDHGIL